MLTTEDAVGHRSRLREKILSNNEFTVLSDYEVLEVLLGYAIPRKDTKPLAKELIRRFGSLAGVFSAKSEDLKSVKGIKDMSSALIRIVHFAHMYILDQSMKERSILESFEEVLNYYFVNIGHLSREELRVLYLNAKAEVLSDECISVGSISEVAIYPREIIDKALKFKATGLILVHNHPSGNPAPSENDIKATCNLYETCRGINLKLYNHIIISPSGMTSFRQLRCPPFEDVAYDRLDKSMDLGKYTYRLGVK
jgi:DNA repair protein RadC